MAVQLVSCGVLLPGLFQDCTQRVEAKKGKRRRGVEAKKGKRRRGVEAKKGKRCKSKERSR